MKNRIAGIAVVLVVACVLTGCKTGGALLKNGVRYDEPGGKAYLGDDYVRARVLVSGVLVKKEERTASNPDAAGINSCTANAMVQLTENIIGKVVEGVMTVSKTVAGKDMTLNDATIQVKSALPALTPHIVYSVMGNECYSHSGAKSVNDFKEQAPCSCEYLGAVKLETITNSIQKVYSSEITAGVKNWLIEYNAK